MVYDTEKLQLASSWKAEKLGLEAELEKLRSELAFTKSNLERFCSLCLLTGSVLMKLFVCYELR